MRRKILKKLLVLNFLIIVILSCSIVTYAGETEDEQSNIINEQLNTREIKNIENEINKSANRDFKELSPIDPEQIIKQAAEGKFKPQLVPFLNKLLSFLVKEIYVNLNIMVKLLVITVFCAVLKQLQSSFLSESVGELAFFVCYAVIIGIVIVSLNTTMNLGRDIIDNMVVFMHTTIPILVGFLITSGSIASGGILQPLLVMSVEVVAGIFKNFLLPLVMISAIISVVNNISDKVNISRLASFSRQICGWGIGIIMTIFIGIVSVQGTLGAVVDGVASKTTKYAIATFVPVAGKYLADAADAVLGCTLLIKNGVGLAVLIGILSICLIPLLKLAAIIIIYRITCALTEPISEKRITGLLNDVATSITYILGISSAVAFMFLMSVTALISAGTISAMMR